MQIPSALHLASFGLAALLATAVSPSLSAATPLADLQGRARALVVAAPSGEDARLLRQRAVFAAMAGGARERDLVLVEAVGDTSEANAIRSALAIDPRAFAAVLVGKDGGAKLRSATVLGPEQLFPTIDAMPMRRNEMRRRAP